MELPSTAPVMILRNAILFPQALVPLYIFEPRYRRLLADVLAGDRMFAVACRKNGIVSQERAEKVAGLGLVRACVTHRDGTSHLVLQGLSRVELGPVVRYQPYRVCRIQPWPTESEQDATVLALAVELLEVVRERLREFPEGLVAELSQHGLPEAASRETATEVFKSLLDHLNAINDPEQVVDLVSAALLADPVQRQIILATRPLETRMRYLLRFLLTPQGTSDDLA